MKDLCFQRITCFSKKVFVFQNHYFSNAASKFSAHKEINSNCSFENKSVLPVIQFCILRSAVALQLRPSPPKVSARAPAHRSYHFRGVKLKSCIKKIHDNLFISKQTNVRIKHAYTEGSSHKKFGTDARVQ